MFTGLVQERGRIAAPPRPSGQGGVRLEIEHSPELGQRLAVGASLAVSGVCLTILTTDGRRSEVELSPETLARTTLGALRAGDRVNLETALRMGDPLGGHWVQGHVDATGEVLERRDLGEHSVEAFSLPAELQPFVVEKGSIAVDGVSLTVFACRGTRFTVALIPHTLAVTTLGRLGPGDRVNVEADILLKQIAAMLRSRRAGRPRARKVR